MIKKFLLFLIAVSFIACAGGPSKESVINNTKTESGDSVWVSSYFNGKVQISKDYKFIGSRERSDQGAIRKYYVWQKDDGTFIFIVDFKARGTWSFSKTNDGLHGNSANNPDILVYKPFDFSLWKKINTNAEKMVTDLGVKIPECYVAFQRNKLSPSRSSAFFIMFVEKTACDYNSWGGVGKRFNNDVSMQ